MKIIKEKPSDLDDLVENDEFIFQLNMLNNNKTIREIVRDELLSVSKLRMNKPTYVICTL